jgi:hypothetical protein
MTTAIKLRLQLDEVDMIAYAGDTEPVCSFYYDDSIDSDAMVDRAREILRRVNLHDKLLDALLDIKRLAGKSGDHEADPFTLLDLIADVTRAALAVVTHQGRKAP